MLDGSGVRGECRNNPLCWPSSVKCQCCHGFEHFSFSLLKRLQLVVMSCVALALQGYCHTGHKTLNVSFPLSSVYESAHFGAA